MDADRQFCRSCREDAGDKADYLLRFVHRSVAFGGGCERRRKLPAQRLRFFFHQRTHQQSAGDDSGHHALRHAGRCGRADRLHREARLSASATSRWARSPTASTPCRRITRALYLQWATAIHKVDPKLKLGGPIFEGVNEDIRVWPDAQGRTSWMGRFVDYLKAHGQLGRSGVRFVRALSVRALHHHLERRCTASRS